MLHTYCGNVRNFYRKHWQFVPRLPSVNVPFRPRIRAGCWRWRLFLSSTPASYLLRGSRWLLAVLANGIIAFLLVFIRSLTACTNVIFSRTHKCTTHRKRSHIYTAKVYARVHCTKRNMNVSYIKHKDIFKFILTSETGRVFFKTYLAFKFTNINTMKT